MDRSALLSFYLLPSFPRRGRWPIPIASRFPRAWTSGPIAFCSFHRWIILAKAMLHKPFRPQISPSVWTRKRVWYEGRETNGSEDDQGRWSDLRRRIPGCWSRLRNQAARRDGPGARRFGRSGGSGGGFQDQTRQGRAGEGLDAP